MAVFSTDLLRDRKFPREEVRQNDSSRNRVRVNEEGKDHDGRRVPGRYGTESVGAAERVSKVLTESQNPGLVPNIAKSSRPFAETTRTDWRTESRMTIPAPNRKKK